ncbi:hypothetical protein OPV22_031295 [Ensete ventricosum]|uniref:CASP-like protein n=1 Tax=Ensete ventricosum TaxID=4639 RepID=A0AAV8PW41_ENSVE|nr:hypothetical protein OPV22_031295 [Ensete ventricosum]
MAEEQQQKAEGIPPRYDLNAKWDACVDITMRRLTYSSLAGAFTALLFFSSPVTRWATVAFAAGKSRPFLLVLPERTITD